MSTASHGLSNLPLLASFLTKLTSTNYSSHRTSHVEYVCSPTRVVNFGRNIVLIFALGVLLNTSLQYQTAYFVGNDGYFHARFSQLLRDAPHLTVAIWLPLTLLARYPLDHHLIFHWMLMPFASWDAIHGTKLFVILASSTVPVVFYIAVRRCSFGTFFSLILLVASSGLLYRLQHPRAQSLSIACFILLLMSLAESRKLLLFIISFLYPWVILTGSLLLLPTAALRVLCSFVRQRSLLLVFFGLPLVGWILGNIVYPHGPSNWYFLFHYVREKISPEISLLGEEWSKPGIADIFSQNILVWLALAASIVACRLQKGRLSEQSWFLALCFCFYLALYIGSRRFVEHWVIVALMMCVYFLRDAQLDPRAIARMIGARFTVLPLVLALGLSNFIAVRSSIVRLGDLNYEAAAAFLSRETREGEMIFHNWDDFPALFFFNSRNTYTVGLDPSYLAAVAPEKARIYEDIILARRFPPSVWIVEHFPSRYVFLSKTRRSPLLQALATDAGVEMLYEDNRGIIYRLLNSD